MDTRKLHIDTLEGQVTQLQTELTRVKDQVANHVLGGGMPAASTVVPPTPATPIPTPAPTPVPAAPTPVPAAPAAPVVPPQNPAPRDPSRHRDH